MGILWLTVVIMIVALALRDGPDPRQLPADWEPTQKTIIRSVV